MNYLSYLKELVLKLKTSIDKYKYIVYNLFNLIKSDGGTSPMKLHQPI